MANYNWPNSRLYSGHYEPVLIDFNFVVDPSAASGLGISSLKGFGVKRVYMHSSSSPSSDNPNPANGYILAQLTENYNGLLFSAISDVPTQSGSNVAVNGSALTLGQLYVITTLGTTTAAEWVTLGLPLGVTPAVGCSFIAIATGAGSGSGQVQVPKATGSGIVRYEQVGDGNKMCNPMTPYYSTAAKGAWFTFQCLAATNSSTTTLVAAAPADGTKIQIQLYMSNSPLLLGGQ